MPEKNEVISTLQNEKNKLEKIIKKMESRLAKAPEGNLRVQKHGKTGYQYFFYRSSKDVKVINNEQNVRDVQNVRDDQNVKAEQEAKHGCNTPFIIVPFDEGGKIVRSVLNITYDIAETVLMDVLPGKGVESLSMLEKQEYQDAVILLASCELKKHDILLRELKQRMHEDRIVDVFAEYLSEEADALQRDSKDQRLRRERTRRILHTLETSGGLTEAFCYHPKHTEATFYLPFVVTDLIQGSIFDTDDYYEAEELREVFFGLEK